VGDSHVGFLRGTSAMTPVWPECYDNYIPGINVYRAGSHLAYSITRPKHPGRAALRSVVDQLPKSDPVLVVYGEIDCRFQIVKQAKRQQRAIADIAHDVVEKYVTSVNRLLGRRDFAFLAICPAMPENPIWKGLYVGTLAERRRAVAAFNTSLHAVAAEHKLPVVDITRDLRSSRAPLASWYCDLMHLAPRAAPLVIDRLADMGWLDDDATTKATAVSLGRLPDLPLPLPQGLQSPQQAIAALVDRAALECAALGAKRIAIFGAGKHTARLGLAGYKARGLRIVAILDDHPSRDRLLGVPIVRATDAPPTIDAIVVSSDTYENALAERARTLTKGRVPIVRLYDWSASTR